MGEREGGRGGREKREGREEGRKERKGEGGRKGGRKEKEGEGGRKGGREKGRGGRGKGKEEGRGGRGRLKMAGEMGACHGKCCILYLPTTDQEITHSETAMTVIANAGYIVFTAATPEPSVVAHYNGLPCSILKEAIVGVEHFVGEKNKPLPRRERK